MRHCNGLNMAGMHPKFPNASEMSTKFGFALMKFKACIFVFRFANLRQHVLSVKFRNLKFYLVDFLLGDAFAFILS